MAETKKTVEGQKCPMFPDAEFTADQVKNIVLFEIIEFDGKPKRKAVPPDEVRGGAIVPDKTDEAMLQAAYRKMPLQEYFVVAMDMRGKTMEGGGRQLVLGKKGNKLEDADDEEEEEEDEDEDVAALQAQVAALEAKLAAPTQSLADQMKEMFALFQQMQPPAPPPPPPPVDVRAEIMREASALTNVLRKPDEDMAQKFREELHHEREIHRAALASKDREIAQMEKDAAQDSAANAKKLMADVEAVRKQYSEEATRAANEALRVATELRTDARLAHAAHAKEQDDLRTAKNAEIERITKAASNELESIRRDRDTTVATLRAQILADANNSAGQLREERARSDTQTATLRTDLETTRRENFAQIQAMRATADAAALEAKAAHGREIDGWRQRYNERTTELAKDNALLLHENARQFSKGELEAKAAEAAKEALSKNSSPLLEAGAQILGPAIQEGVRVIGDLQKNAQAAALQAQQPPRVEYREKIVYVDRPVAAPAPAPAPTPTPAPAPAPAPASAPAEAPIPPFSARNAESVSTVVPEPTPAPEAPPVVAAETPPTTQGPHSASA